MSVLDLVVSTFLGKFKIAAWIAVLISFLNHFAPFGRFRSLRIM